MTALAMWLYGILCLSCAIMVLAWGKAALDLGRDNDEGLLGLVWCKPFVLAAGLTVHSVAMGVACGYRIFDIVLNQVVAFGSEVAIQISILLALGFSKTMFVWAASMRPNREVRWHWWLYLYLLINWGVFCLAWARYMKP